VEETALEINKAKNVFATTVIETGAADFSDRIGNSDLAKSYRVTRAPESLQVKLTRIERELDDAARMAQEEGDTKAQHKVISLKDILSKLSIKNSSRQEPYSTLGEGALISPALSPSQREPHHASSTDLAILADLESRVSTLEQQLGLDTSDGATAARPLIVTLKDLQRKASLLTTNSKAVDNAVKNLEPIIARVEKLQTLSRQQATSQKGKPLTIEPQEAKVQELYSKLAVIERLQSLAPVLLARLETLQLIHADAAAAESAVKDFDATLSSIQDDFKKWMEALRDLENKLLDHSQKSADNRREVKLWLESIKSRSSP
jgi:nuclear migration protein JNM1